ncbi:ABC transporter substrate-binding protein [Brevibacillus fluminis]|uniref:ABC transporter substrate-binding protein n=1 Tax=Brevibacillus fluminis TaxID=511487 RepID=A0A3M8DHR3_9BACL|nr:ABC transporter substrate-binding protein [Brevibacillus fluminis]RNB87139.1 ABC transporter substrate-binding protein [Brevibacillus fluminis]
MTNRFFKRKYLLLIACLLMMATGCSQTPSPSKETGESGKAATATEPKKGGTITIGYPAEPDSLDVHKSAMVASSFITSLIGGALVYYDPKTQEIKPNLAESYTVSKDGKTLTFTLRAGVRFHDGTPLTAKAYKQTLERALAPETASPLGGYMFGSIQSVSAPDDKTLILQLKEPSAQLVSNLWDPSIGQPLSMSAVDKLGTDYGRNPVGVGPWKFESWKTGDSVTLVRNEAYQWGNPSDANQGPPRADKLVIKFIKENQTMMAALESGAIDIAAYVPAKEITKYKDSDQVSVLENQKWGLSFLEMNTTREILQDQAVRQAVNKALNKEAIVKAVLHGEGVVANTPLPPSLFGYDPASEQYGYRYDAAEAQKLLENAGWIVNSQGIREKNGKSLTLTLSLSESDSRIGELIQIMLKNIGVGVTIQKMDQAALIESAGTGQFDMAIVSYVDNDPNAMSLFFDSSQIGSTNHSRVNNEQLDSLLKKGRTTLDKEERSKIYADIQKLLVEQAYWAPLYSEKEFYLVSKRVQGVKLQPMYGLSFQDSWVNK